MVELELSAAEHSVRKLKPEHLQQAVAALRDDGFVVLHRAIEPAHIEMLRERMLGEGVKNAFYSGNTCLPNTTQQPLHVDAGQLWPNLKVATPAYGLVVNVPVVDATSANGSTELWPGTHLDTTRALNDGDIKLPPTIEERLRAECKPLQPNVPAGSVLIRDMRLWHRGMPNLTDQPRPMIAMIHWTHWWHTKKPLLFPKGTEELFADSTLETVAEFVDGPIDYISRNRKYDYSK